MSRFAQVVIGSLFLLVFINLVGLWSVELASKRKVSELEVGLVQSEEVAAPIRSADDQPQVLETEQEDQTVVAQDTTGLESSITDLDSRVTELERSQTSVAPQVVGSSKKEEIKEQVVFLGTGSTTSRDWVEIENATVELNSYNYSSGTTMLFEANLSIISGEVYARLLNKTTGIPLAQTQLSHNTSATTLKIAPPVGLASASNEYVVELKSTSGEKAILHSARLRVQQ